MVIWPYMLSCWIFQFYPTPSIFNFEKIKEMQKSVHFVVKSIEKKLKNISDGVIFVLLWRILSNLLGMGHNIFNMQLLVLLTFPRISLLIIIYQYTKLMGILILQFLGWRLGCTMKYYLSVFFFKFPKIVGDWCAYGIYLSWFDS